MILILKKFFKFSGEENEKKFKLAIILGVIDALMSACRIPAIMYIMMGIINKEPLEKYIWGSLAIMGVTVLISILIKMKTTMLQTRAGYNCAAFKRIEIAEKLRFLPMGYFNENSIGYIASITTNTMESLGDIATRIVMVASKGFLETATIIIMMAFFDYRIALIAFAGSAVFLLVNNMMQNAGKEVSKQKQRCDTEVVNQVVEYIQGISEVKSYNLFGKQAKKLDIANSGSAETNIKMEKVFVPYHFAQAIVVKLTGAAIMAVSILLYINGKMSLLYAIGMSLAAFMLLASLETAGNFSSLFHLINAYVDKGNSILELDTMDVDGEAIEPSSYDIELKDVEFSYEKKKIINGISLKIPEKTTTAVVGPSGGGKTTITKLIARFWDVDSGEVLLGGKNVKDYSMNSLMKNFSFVFQNVYLFNDTIENNIKFAKPDATHEEVVEAAKKACCDEFISKLPDGYNTIIGEGGASLSGGEKQRISIARAIMKDSPIIILDEATANVDPENEKELTLAIEALTKEKTIIMIAHRLKTVRNADQIVVIDDGRIVQKGTHNELMQKEGIYRRFVDSRKLAVSWKI